MFLLYKFIELKILQYPLGVHIFQLWQTPNMPGLILPVIVWCMVTFMYRNTLCTTDMLRLAKQDQVSLVLYFVYQFWPYTDNWKCNLHPHQSHNSRVKMLPAVQFSVSVSHPNHTSTHATAFHQMAWPVSLSTQWFHWQLPINHITCVMFYVCMPFFLSFLQFYLATTELPLQSQTLWIGNCLCEWTRECIQSLHKMLKFVFFIDQIMTHTGVQMKIWLLYDKL